MRDTEKFTKKLIEAFGGTEALRQRVTERLTETNRLWNQDSELIGRLLRCHLFVEHFLTAYLRFQNPGLGDLDAARLTFAQKVALAERVGTPEHYVFAGVRHLNKMRNRIAHTLRAEVTEEDRDVFLGIRNFASLRRALAEHQPDSDESIDVVEAFARHAGSVLQHHSGPDAEIWARVTRESESDD
jgi:hypothetical protein